MSGIKSDQMTVAELILHLKAQPPEAKVSIETYVPGLDADERHNQAFKPNHVDTVIDEDGNKTTILWATANAGRQAANALDRARK